MKKKLIALTAIAMIAVTFAGCAQRSSKISSEVAQANPWKEFDSLELAQEEVGFEITVPDLSAYGSEVYRVCVGLNELEIQYGEQAAYVRKAKDDGDISGDYEAYASEESVTVGENTVTFKGSAKDSVNLAVWTAGKYAYCIGVKEGVSAEEMTKLVSGTN